MSGGQITTLYARRFPHAAAPSPVTYRTCDSAGLRCVLYGYHAVHTTLPVLPVRLAGDAACLAASTICLLRPRLTEAAHTQLTRDSRLTDVSQSYSPHTW